MATLYEIDKAISQLVATGIPLADIELTIKRSEVPAFFVTVKGALVGESGAIYKGIPINIIDG